MKLEILQGPSASSIAAIRTYLWEIVSVMCA